MKTKPKPTNDQERFKAQFHAVQSAMYGRSYELDGSILNFITATNSGLYALPKPTFETSSRTGYKQGIGKTVKSSDDGLEVVIVPLINAVLHNDPQTIHNFADAVKRAYSRLKFENGKCTVTPANPPLKEALDELEQASHDPQAIANPKATIKKLSQGKRKNGIPKLSERQLERLAEDTGKLPQKRK